MYNLIGFVTRICVFTATAVVVATVKVFLNLSANQPEIQRHVVERTKAPLVAQVSVFCRVLQCVEVCWYVVEGTRTSLVV